jgi:uracil-DNA glycosylase family 4
MPTFSLDCRRCPRLSSYLEQVRADYPAYYGRPVPSFGDPAARLLIVGLAPGLHGANASGRPFTGDYAGILLYETLHRFGYASSPESVSADDGLELRDCRITNAVRCLPPRNKPGTDEVNRCNDYLVDELGKLPTGGVIIALGTIAHRAVLRARGERQSAFPFGHGAKHRFGDGIHLLDSYHCSRYNTQTRRLTPTMFASVFRTAAKLLAEP